jgi:hypothetical protein
MNRHRDNQGRFIKGKCKVVLVPPVASSSSVARKPPYTNLLAGRSTRGKHTRRRPVAPPEPKEKSIMDNPKGQGATPSETLEHIFEDLTTQETLIGGSNKKPKGEEINPIWEP